MFPSVPISDLRELVATYANDFDAGLITAAQAVVVVDEAARIEKMAATLKSLAAARAAETDVLEREGDASPAHALARRTGTTVGKASEALRTGKLLVSQPELDAAARRGEVSPEQASAISDAAAADPTAVARLVEKAKQASLAELRNECERTKAAADSDAEERHRRIHAARCARRRSCPDGSAEILYRSTREEVAEVWAVLSGFANQIFHRARLSGQREPSEAYAADGVLAMARTAGGGARGGAGAHRGSAGPAVDEHPHQPVVVSGAAAAIGPPPAPVAPVGLSLPVRSPVPTKIVVRVDWAALLRGWVAEGETCEIAGIGPVAVSAVRAMVATGDPFLAAVVTKGVDVVSVAHLGRRPTAFQQTALEWLAPSCRVEGCDAVARLEFDHRHDWADTHVTLLRWLDPLCSCHHDRKTFDGWALVAGAGKRPLVPPDDPRHPRHQGSSHHEGEAMCDLCNGDSRPH